MPASVPQAVIHGDSLDTTVGPNADLTACYFDGDPTANAGHRNRATYRNYQNHESGFVMSTPFYEGSFSVIIKQEAGLFATIHPGSGITRANMPALAERGGHSFPLASGNAGYFMIGDIGTTFTRGEHRRCSFPVSLILFNVTTVSEGDPT